MVQVRSSFLELLESIIKQRYICGTKLQIVAQWKQNLRLQPFDIKSEAGAPSKCSDELVNPILPGLLNTLQTRAGVFYPPS